MGLHGHVVDDGVAEGRCALRLELAAAADNRPDHLLLFPMLFRNVHDGRVDVQEVFVDICIEGELLLLVLRGGKRLRGFCSTGDGLATARQLHGFAWVSDSIHGGGRAGHWLYS